VNHSSFSQRIGAKIVAAEPVEAFACMMTCQDDVAKKRNNEFIITYHLSAKATDAKMLSKPPKSEKMKQDVIALTSLSSLSLSLSLSLTASVGENLLSPQSIMLPVLMVEGIE
jgi:hypothetical protein